MSLYLWTIVIAVLTAVASSLAGVLLVVKREAFLSEGLSHSVLPGIIFAFLIFQDRYSPLLLIGAGLSGLVMVWLVQWICKSGLVYSDAALGIVFSGMFSIGVIASSMELGNQHFHAHCIIDGNLAFAPLSTFEWGGWNLGPKSFVIISICLAVLLAFVCLFYKELKITALDPVSARLLGFRPLLLHYLWMTIVSIVAVAAFETAGTLLVVALMIAPAAAANLLTHRLSTMFWLSALIGAVSAAFGMGASFQLDISPAGPIASAAGILFLLIAFFAPRGILGDWFKKRRLRKELLSQLASENV